MNSKELGFRELFPDAWEELKRVTPLLEAYFQDACDIEFVVEWGRLYILQVRPAKKAPRATVRIAIDLFKEGVIAEEEVIRRISLEHVLANLADEIEDVSTLRLLCRGLPASPGATTGPLLINPASARELHGAILVLTELQPEDMTIVPRIAGLVTQRGGMTSHAAVVSRGLQLPAIIGAGDIEIDFESRRIYVGAVSISEGQWVTIDGAEGSIYIGKAKMNKKSWIDDQYMTYLSGVIEQGILSGTWADENLAKAWLFRDMLCHSWVPGKRLNSETLLPSAVPKTQQYVDTELFSELDRHPSHLHNALQFVYQGLLSTLTRLLAEYVGLGQHYRFMQPLWNPANTITFPRQRVGIEFFNINQFVPHLIDIFSVKCVLEVSMQDERDAWVLDTINPRGASLVPGSMEVASSGLWINGARVELNDIVSFYHIFRRREYYWKWYEANNASHAEIIGFLRSGAFRYRHDSRLYALTFQLGLVKDGQPTIAGEVLMNADDQDVIHDAPDDYLETTVRRLQSIVDSVFLRGYEDRSGSVDDYSLLVKRREFRDLVAGEIYESYFPPSRHEFDYLLVKEIVDAVSANPVAAYAATAIAGGVIGNAAYDLIKKFARTVAEKFRERDEERAGIWSDLADDVQKIELYFQRRDHASTREIEDSTGIERERLVPLLKLLGFKFDRTKGRSGWICRGKHPIANKTPAPDA
jgi:phosphohistidine swiveling domain-containing protein